MCPQSSVEVAFGSERLFLLCKKQEAVECNGISTEHDFQHGMPTTIQVSNETLEILKNLRRTKNASYNEISGNNERFTKSLRNNVWQDFIKKNF
ncbi:MAG: hypothetical protein QW331_03365 [Candidatus Woesearchaeota archaeon]